jgi:hypothetical protein
MANIIKPKRTNTAGNTPTTSNLTSGELGVNMADQKTYINNGTSVVQIGAGKLVGLGDVNITSPTNAQALIYDTATSKWINGAGGGGGAGTVTSVSGTGTVSGLTLTGTVTTSGSLTLGGTLSVANSSTTATNVNSPSTIVLRDPSGNFIAGTITANLTGNATGLSSTLATTSGGTGLTSFTANGVVYASSSSALATGSALTFDTARLSFIKASNSRAWSPDGDDLLAIENSSSANFDMRASTTGASYVMFSDTDARARGYVAYLHNTDQMPFAVAGSEGMRLTSTGLGIGTSSPSYKLDVRRSSDGGIGYFRRIGATINPALMISANETGNTVGFSTDYAGSVSPAMTFTTQAVERLRITSGGDVGIGTTSPANKLDVISANLTTSGSASFRVSTDSGNSAATTIYTYGSAYVAGSLYSVGANGTVWRTPANAAIDLAASSFFAIGQNNAERLRVDASGNLGLGMIPSAFTNGRYIQILSTTAFGQQASGTANVMANAYESSANAFSYILTVPATRYALTTTGQHQWFNAPSGTAGTAISFTQAMTLDASGNLLVGSTTFYGGSGKLFKLQTAGAKTYSEGVPVQGISSVDTTAMAAGVGGSIVFTGQYDTSSNYTMFAGIEGQKTNATTGNYAGDMVFKTRVNGGNLTEYFRIANTGAFGLSGVNYGTSGQVLTSQGSGSAPIWASNISSQWTTTGSNIYYSTGGVIVGSNTAYGNAKLTLNATTNPTTSTDANNQLYIGESSQNPNYYLNVGYINVAGGYSGSIQSISGASGSALLLNLAGGNVGIGTSQPNRTLTIANGGPVVEIDPAGTSGTDPIYFNYNRSTASYLTPRHWALAHVWNYNGGTEGMRFDGQLMVGTSAGNSSAGGGHFTGPILQGASGLYQAQISINSGNTIQALTLGVGYETLRLNPLGGSISACVTSGDLLVGTSGSVGKLCVLQTSASIYGVDIRCNSPTYANAVFNIGADRNTTNGTYTMIQATRYGAVTCFKVLDSGNVQNTNNSYGAISDIKLKENIVDATPKLANLMQVKIRNYNLIGESNKQLGVVAQELETVFPAMVEEITDRDTQGNDLGTTTKSVKYSVFVPMLVKALQEQQAIIELLKARLDAANL